MVYVVVGNSDTLNIYKIRNPGTGQIKRVHRNLLMPVNFLPVPAWNEGSHIDDSVEISSVCTSCDRDTQTESEDRTSRWVADLNAAADVQRDKSVVQSDAWADTVVSVILR